MTYPIGTPGIPWTSTERAAWRAQQRRSRSYAEHVLPRIQALAKDWACTPYGQLQYERDYPLFGLRSPQWDASRPTALITGGVHGYETSGVMGALSFAEDKLAAFGEHINLAVAPCVSPWGFEHIQRWNPETLDPNRCFAPGRGSPEAEQLMAWVASLGPVHVHIDLHETTDTDNSEFRPAKAARDGGVQTSWNIPDGFYLVDRSDRPQPAFQAAMIEAVAKVTHIAEADADGKLIGVPLQQHGVIAYDAVPLGLCMAMTDAAYCSTTEVYPDSPRTDPEACIQAQVAAICGGLAYVLERTR